MKAERLIEIVDEISELLNTPIKDLERLADEIDIKNSHYTDGDYFKKLTAWNICHHLAEERRDYGKLQECVQRHDLGLGGERIVQIAIDTIDKQLTPQTEREE